MPSLPGLRACGDTVSASNRERAEAHVALQREDRAAQRPVRPWDLSIDLSGLDLLGADLRDARLRDADMAYAKGLPEEVTP
ncbi:MAG: pentapeptide repeat-containing protein [Deltaproteobacteria bacterium]|nr:pentapeptide repeat-containing protein [Deltaproteobacteria bacterium]